ncbi:SMI1/KNR4 family protein [Rhodoferax sp. AJA081-3]|uniref:SMI1/KNR4 family protein n=1 Tax=Rhodoferax sp. AJA081-3 TaxID=2752316 RepID=UPI001ADED251|nr:SMI1/KNR4 family protein [Rhodoferax sp. AJA081-3]QTN27478.1 SMI1/KNR4 family protein [Rhodoferax sp. AJA081-3]
MTIETPLSSKSSGYAASPADWSNFLDCWRETLRHRPHDLPKDQFGVPVFSMMATYRKGSQKNSSSDSDAALKSIEQLQVKLNVVLPPSYVDFVIAFGPTAFPEVIPDTDSHARGFYPLEEVDFMKRRRPDIVEIEESYPRDSGSEKYFVYGTKQDDVAVRTKYYRNAIVVGAYSKHELLLLNPVVKTQDGEMEAILLMHSSSFRAPSFAELVRQVSVAETVDVKRSPPYPQEKLIGTCASKLPMKNIWWE